MSERMNGGEECNLLIGPGYENPGAGRRMVFFVSMVLAFVFIKHNFVPLAALLDGYGLRCSYAAGNTLMQL